MCVCVCVCVCACVQDVVTQLQNRLDRLVHAVGDTIEVIASPEPPDRMRVRSLTWLPASLKNVAR